MLAVPFSGIYYLSIAGGRWHNKETCNAKGAGRWRGHGNLGGS